MQNELKTPYRHKLGPVVVSQGIGGSRGPWGAYIRKASGSLKRFKPIGLQATPLQVLKKLEEYQGTALTKDEAARTADGVSK